MNINAFNVDKIRQRLIALGIVIVFSLGVLCFMLLLMYTLNRR